MKDYFDLDLLLREDTPSPAELRRAIGATFARRRLALPDDWPAGLGDAFAGDPVKQAQWTGFLRKNRLDLVALPEVIARLRAGLARLDPAATT